VGSGHHTKDPHFRYIERLRGLLSTSLPIFFQSEKPKNERHVQDAGEAALKTARESLERESPQIPFGVISTKPDFARIQHDGISLFVEFKYPKDRRRLNSIVTEMTSRVTIYRDQGAWVLFLVYDPQRAIVDDARFIEPFMKHEGVWIGISR
jgi:hypothetical protein